MGTMIADGVSKSDGAADIILDLRGLKCPLPVFHARKALAALPSGAILEVQCTDPMAALDLPHLLCQTGHILLGRSTLADVLTFRIRAANQSSGKSTMYLG